ncbi:sugar phosphate phosphate translocator [Raphidocelis subcapitata]|uniref:Sugar phosphate phosphate translocator n=1 Tax=Raphidocelis subcapitata TaxID=307507 RepID=A0A2V0P0M4_9CHLO|nr:sugar phosphate phosphate translocator [Raphidocelis subcapitata]|eukprot:GBF93418.1 sugar phosphate phosphate translocator [Raphidocelis subcapitata]
MAPLQYVEVEQAPKAAAASAAHSHGRSPRSQAHALHGHPGGGGAAGSGGSWLASQEGRMVLWTGSMIACWYVLGTALGMYNKLVVGKDHGIGTRGAFPAPLLMSGVQFGFQALLAQLVFGTGLAQRSAPPMAWREWARLVLPNGAITGLDIGLSNKSLVYITMSFYTMCKSTTPLFLLLFAFIWRLEQPSWSLAGIVAIIVTGLLLLVEGEAKFDATGFALVMTAACMSGLRFTLTQVLLHGHGGQGGHSPFGGPLEVLRALTPVMSLTTLALSLATERLWETLPRSGYFSDAEGLAVTALLILVGAVIAFAMVLAEYEVIKQTSALTFMIAGIVKEILTIIAAVIAFGDPFGWLNGLGLAIAVGGVALFNLYKLRKLRLQAEAEASEIIVRPRRGSDAIGGGGGMGEGGLPAGGGSGPGAKAAAGGGGGDAALVLRRPGAAPGADAAGEEAPALESEPLLPGHAPPSHAWQR